MSQNDCIYLTIEQIDELQRLAHLKPTRYGAVTMGIELRGDDFGRSSVTLVASMADHDNCYSMIEPDGASPGWER